MIKIQRLFKLIVNFLLRCCAFLPEYANQKKPTTTIKHRNKWQITNSIWDHFRYIFFFGLCTHYLHYWWHYWCTNIIRCLYLFCICYFFYSYLCYNLFFFFFFVCCNHFVCCADIRLKRAHSTERCCKCVHNKTKYYKKRTENVTPKIVNKHIMLKIRFVFVTFPQHYRFFMSDWLLPLSVQRWLFLGKDFDNVVSKWRWDNCIKNKVRNGVNTANDYIFTHSK